MQTLHYLIEHWYFVLFAVLAFGMDFSESEGQKAAREQRELEDEEWANAHDNPLSPNYQP